MPPKLCLDKHPARPGSCCASGSSMVCGSRCYDHSREVTVRALGTMLSSQPPSY